jgi:hypothetical protein
MESRLVYQHFPFKSADAHLIENCRPDSRKERHSIYRRALMMLGQENQTKHLNVCLVQHRLEEGSGVV